MLQKVHSITWKVENKSPFFIIVPKAYPFCGVLQWEELCYQAGGAASCTPSSCSPAASYGLRSFPALWPQTTAGRREEGYFFLPRYGLVGWRVGLVVLSPSALQPINMSRHLRSAVWKVKGSSSKHLSQKPAWNEKSRHSWVLLLLKKKNCLGEICSTFSCTSNFKSSLNSVEIGW